MKPSQDPSPDIDPDDPEARFIEQMGLVCEYDNMPRIAGRALGLLIIEEGPFSLRDLADRLQVSRASVSTNARMLTELGFIDHVARPGDRQDYYQLAEDPFRRMLEGKVKGLLKMVSVFSEAADAFPRDREAAIERLREMAAFHQAAADTVTELIEQSSTQKKQPERAGSNPRSRSGDPRWL